MTESLLERSARYIDGAVYEGPRTVNPIDGSFHEVAEGVGLVCGFSHIWTVDADQGLVVLDTSLPGFASVALEHLRRWRDAPVDTIVFTHGHVDHVGGARVFLDDAAERKRPSPTVVAHDAVVRRFDRYDLTRDYNEIINGRQFGPNFRLGSFAGDWVQPEVTYTDGLDLEVGAASLRLIHEKGETDDHTIAWVPQQGVLFTGDLIIWSFPNAGNPQKAQRYPAEWAAEVSAMAGGAGALARRARELCEAGDLRLACQLAEWAAQAAPADAEVHATRAEVYRVRRDRELSLMARGLYLDASRSSEVVSQPIQAPD